MITLCTDGGIKLAGSMYVHIYSNGQALCLPFILLREDYETNDESMYFLYAVVYNVQILLYNDFFIKNLSF